MFRKTKYKSSLFPSGKWTEKVRRVQPEKNNELYFEEVSCDDISQMQLDIQAINLDVMLKNGVTLNPVQVGRMLNVTDSFDVEQYNDRNSLNLYNYLKENQQSIVDSLKQFREKQIESISE